MKQQTLPGFEKIHVKTFGGSLLKGNPREARPISVKRPMHMVMRSSLAIKENSFLRTKNSKRVKEIIFKHASRTNVQIYRLALSGNHIHFIVLPKSREAFHAFVRVISGLITRAILHVEKGRCAGLRFWDARPFTRILEWGREFKSVGLYLLQNTLEAAGFMQYKPRKLQKTSGSG